MVKKKDFSLTLMLDEKPKVVTSEDPPNDSIIALQKFRQVLIPDLHRELRRNFC